MEFFFCLRGEADDDIGSERDIGDDFAQQGDFFKILFDGVDPVHFFQDAVRACLDREMDKFAEGGEIADRLHELDG